MSGYSTTVLEASGASDAVFSLDQTKLFVTHGGDIDVFDLATHTKISTWHIGTAVGALTLSEDGSFLLASDPRQPLLYRVSTSTGTVTGTFQGNGNYFNDVEIVDNTYAIVTNTDYTSTAHPALLNLQTGVFTAIAATANISGRETLTEDSHLTLIADGNSSGGPVHIFDDRTGKITANGSGSFYNYGVQAISEAAGMALLGHYSQGVAVYDLNLRYLRDVNVGYVNGIAFDPSGKYVYIAGTQSYSGTGTVVEYDTATFNEIARFTYGTTSSTNSANVRYGDNLLASRDGGFIVVTDPDQSSIKLIDTHDPGQTFVGTPGNHVVTGGTGSDTLVLAGAQASYEALVSGGKTFLIGSEGAYQVNSIEQVRFADGTVALANAVATAPAFDALRYIASQPDLIRAFGTDAQAATAHYVNTGFAEGRNALVFDAREYLASNPDVLAYFGDDPAAATRHFIQYGFAEHRPTATFDPLEYLASNPDLAVQFGNNPAAALSHYLDYGVREGRPTASFDAREYLASNPDLLLHFGNDPAAALKHYVEYGAGEHRATASFDARAYLAANADVLRALGDDPAAALAHYLDHGAQEGRVTSGFDAVGYLLSNVDLENAGLGSTGALQHWLDYGAREGRGGDALFGREQANHVLSIGTQARGAIDAAGDHDWFGTTLTAGQHVTFAFHGDAVDATLEVHDAAGHLLQAFHAGQNGTIVFTASAAGTFYLTVADTAAHTGAYTIDMIGA